MTRDITIEGVTYRWSPSRDLTQFLQHNEEVELSNDEARELMVKFYQDKNTI